MAAGLSTIIGFFAAWMPHESPWVEIATNTPEDFNPQCRYQVELDQTWFFAAAVNKDALLLTPYGSLENAEAYVLKIAAAQKNSLIIESSRSTSEQPLGFETIRRWCPSTPEKVDLNRNSSFNLDCFHWINEEQAFYNYLPTSYDKTQLELIPKDFDSLKTVLKANIQSDRKNTTVVQKADGLPSTVRTNTILSQCQNVEWKEFPDHDSTKKVIEEAKDGKLQASSFSRDCFYRVQLDNDPSWQTAFGTDNGGFTLYINTYFPDSVTGTQKTIDWMSADQYTRTRKGEEKTTGNVKRIQYFCPQ
ncbi:hypothetical protein [Endozoicomonas numazuensis]|uniref:Uncharacterized protein n=1 Tax=Endozoicomonas numazuensis TaxID=1137799 RepID=A0A081N146_9GAMM|nr:hypothetical protein [Endozoicomonas numazuensis]KEQ12169.1 hypothetical protein GZ78_27350 [Endozoicomonas numazuensis]